MLPRLQNLGRASNLKGLCRAPSRVAFHSSSILLRGSQRSHVRYDDTPKKTVIEFKEAPQKTVKVKPESNSLSDLLAWYRRFRVPLIALMLISLGVLKALDQKTKFNALSPEDQQYVCKGGMQWACKQVGREIEQKYVYSELELARSESESWWSVLQADVSIESAQRIVKCLNVHRDDFTKEDKKNSRGGGIVRYATLPSVDGLSFVTMSEKEIEGLRALGQAMHEDVCSSGGVITGQGKNDQTKGRTISQTFSPPSSQYGDNSLATVHRTTCTTAGQCVCNLWLHRPNTVENALFGGSASVQDRDVFKREASVIQDLPAQQQSLLRQLPRVIYPYFVTFAGSPEYTKYLQGYTGMGHGNSLQFTQFPPSSVDEDTVTEQSSIFDSFKNKKAQRLQNEEFRAVRTKVEQMDSVLNSSKITMPAAHKVVDSFPIGMNRDLIPVQQVPPPDTDGSYQLFMKDPYTDTLVYPTRVPYSLPAPDADKNNNTRDFSRESVTTQVNVPEHHNKLMNLLLIRSIQGLAFLKDYGDEQRLAGANPTSLPSVIEEDNLNFHLKLKDMLKDISNTGRAMRDGVKNKCMQFVDLMKHKVKNVVDDMSDQLLQDDMLSTQLSSLFAPDDTNLRILMQKSSKMDVKIDGNNHILSNSSLSNVISQCPADASRRLQVLFSMDGEPTGLRYFMSGEGSLTNSNGELIDDLSSIPDEHVHLLPYSVRVLRDPRALHWNPNEQTIWESVRSFVLTVVCPVVPARMQLLTSAFLIIYTLSRLSIIGLDISAENQFGSLKPRAAWRKLLVAPCRLIARVCLLGLGFHWISCKGTLRPAKEAPILVANHISLVDTILMYLLAGPNAAFIAKAGVLHIPLFSSIILANGSILVDRKDPNSRRAVQNEITRRALHTYNNDDDPFDHTVVFPEGTTTVGDAILRFKEGAFRPGVPVQPVVLRYPHYFFNPTYAGPDKTGITCFLRTVTQLYNQTSVNILPVYVPTEQEKNDPKLYARNVQRTMAQAAMIPM